MATSDEIDAEVSTFERDDGTMQVTVNDQPIYYFAQDEEGELVADGAREGARLGLSRGTRRGTGDRSGSGERTRSLRRPRSRVTVLLN